MRGPRGPQKTSTDDPVAVIGTQEPIPDQNIFGVRADPAFALVEVFFA